MSAFKTDGTFTTATQHGAARIVLPIPRDTTAKIYEIDYMVAFSSYTPLAISTAHATYTTAYLIEESGLTDEGGGICSFTRRYATIPAARDEFASFAYKFPGLKGSTNPPYSQYWTADNGGGRDPFTQTVTSRLRHEYYLCAAGQTYTTPGAIPLLSGLIFNLDDNDDARFDYLLPSGVYWSDTDPTKEEWLTLAGGGTGIGSGANAGEFIPEDSTVEQWAGNIYVRITRYLKAK